MTQLKLIGNTWKYWTLRFIFHSAINSVVEKKQLHALRAQKFVTYADNKWNFDHSSVSAGAFGFNVLLFFCLPHWVRSTFFSQTKALLRQLTVSIMCANKNVPIDRVCISKRQNRMVRIQSVCCKHKGLIVMTVTELFFFYTLASTWILHL